MPQIHAARPAAVRREGEELMEVPSPPAFAAAGAALRFDATFGIHPCEISTARRQVVILLDSSSRRCTYRQTRRVGRGLLEERDGDAEVVGKAPI